MNLYQVYLLKNPRDRLKVRSQDPYLALVATPKLFVLSLPSWSGWLAEMKCRAESGE